MEMSPITLNSIGNATQSIESQSTRIPTSVPFAGTFGHLLQEVNQHQQNVANGVSDLAAGNGESLQQIAIDVAKAELSFRFVMELRDRLISSYQEVMRMQV